MVHSLMIGAAKLGMHMSVASPVGYQPDPAVVEKTLAIAAETGSEIVITNDPREAIVDADVVYTDVWASMGFEAEQKEREKHSPTTKSTKHSSPSRSQTTCSCTASRRTAAKKYPLASSTARTPSSSTKPRTACTRKKPSWPQSCSMHAHDCIEQNENKLGKNISLNSSEAALCSHIGKKVSLKHCVCPTR